MSDDIQADDDALSPEAQTLADQAREIARLRQQIAEQRLAEDLREAITFAAATNFIATPITHDRLLEMIVETAAHMLAAEAASLFLIDEVTQELVFEVALGQKAQEVKKFRIPLGHGIAGLTAVSGQPMVVSGNLDDPRRALDIAQSIGYTPESILCVPLYYNDQVIGVLELLDKQCADTFSAADMEALSLFANQAAVAIEQSRIQRNIIGLMREVLLSFNITPSHQPFGLHERVQILVTQLESEPHYRHALDLAQLVQEIAQYGEAELKVGHHILHSFVEYLRMQPTPSYSFGGSR